MQKVRYRLVDSKGNEMIVRVPPKVPIDAKVQSVQLDPDSTLVINIELDPEWIKKTRAAMKARGET